MGVAEQLVLPTAALLVLGCTFLGGVAVLVAGIVLALSVTAGVVLTALRTARERREEAPAA
ncbi:Low temperature requirement protein A OS=Streptomyces tendae OX=1932 GN=GUR47_27345 PE=4 SV=1 [Streptomyces tendae]